MSNPNTALLEELARRRAELRSEAQVDRKLIKRVRDTLSRLADDDAYWKTLADEHPTSRSGDGMAWAALAADWAPLLDSVGWTPPPSAKDFVAAEFGEPLEQAIAATADGRAEAAREARHGLQMLIDEIDRLAGTGPDHNIVMRGALAVTKSLHIRFSRRTRRRLFRIGRFAITYVVPIALGVVTGGAGFAAAGATLGMSPAVLAGAKKAVGLGAKSAAARVDKAYVKAYERGDIDARRLAAQTLVQIAQDLDLAAAALERAGTPAPPALVGACAVRYLGAVSLIDRDLRIPHVTDVVGENLWTARGDPTAANLHAAGQAVLEVAREVHPLDVVNYEIERQREATNHELMLASVERSLANADKRRAQRRTVVLKLKTLSETAPARVFEEPAPIVSA